MAFNYTISFETLVRTEFENFKNQRPEWIEDLRICFWYDKDGDRMNQKVDSLLAYTETIISSLITSCQRISSYTVTQCEFSIKDVRGEIYVSFSVHFSDGEKSIELCLNIFENQTPTYTLWVQKNKNISMFENIVDLERELNELVG